MLHDLIPSPIDLTCMSVQLGKPLAFSMPSSDPRRSAICLVAIGQDYSMEVQKIITDHIRSKHPNRIIATCHESPIEHPVSILSDSTYAERHAALFFGIDLRGVKKQLKTDIDFARVFVIVGAEILTSLRDVLTPHGVSYYITEDEAREHIGPAYDEMADDMDKEIKHRQNEAKIMDDFSDLIDEANRKNQTDQS